MLTDSRSAPAADATILVTAIQAAALLACSTKTVGRLAKADPSFPRPVKIGVAVRFHRAALEAWAAARAGLPAAAGSAAA